MCPHVPKAPHRPRVPASARLRALQNRPALTGKTDLYSWARTICEYWIYVQLRFLAPGLVPGGQSGTFGVDCIPLNFASRSRGGTRPPPIVARAILRPANKAAKYR